VAIYFINAFGGYYINGYWWLSILLMLLVAIILMAIGGYCNNGYWWLFH
jgi:hypothetical protein